MLKLCYKLYDLCAKFLSFIYTILLFLFLKANEQLAKYCPKQQEQLASRFTTWRNRFNNSKNGENTMSSTSSNNKTSNGLRKMPRWIERILNCVLISIVIIIAGVFVGVGMLVKMEQGGPVDEDENGQPLPRSRRSRRARGKNGQKQETRRMPLRPSDILWFQHFDSVHNSSFFRLKSFHDENNNENTLSQSSSTHPLINNSREQLHDTHYLSEDDDFISTLFSIEHLTNVSVEEFPSTAKKVTFPVIDSSALVDSNNDDNANLRMMQFHPRPRKLSKRDRWCQKKFKRCYAAECYAPQGYYEGGCLASPFFFNKSSPKPKYAVQLECPHLKDQRNEVLTKEKLDFEDVQDNNNNNNDTKNDSNALKARLLRFKRSTSFFFPKWFDWTGKCWRRNTSSANVLAQLAEEKALIADAHAVEEQRRAKAREAAKKQASSIGFSIFGSNKKHRQNGHSAHDQYQRKKERQANSVHEKQQQKIHTSTTRRQVSNDGKASDDPHHDFIMEGFHHAKDGLYRLHNLCIDPKNRLFAGYVPPARRKQAMMWAWRGTDDTWPVTTALEPGFQNLITQQRHAFHVADKPASCYLDTKVMLYPISVRAENMGHMFYRAGSALRVIEAAFGKNAMVQKENVTVMYLAIDEVGRGHVEERRNTMEAFYEILGTSWAGVYAPPTTKGAKDYRTVPSLDDGNFTCFREIVLWQNSMVMNQERRYGNRFPLDESAHDSVPGRTTSFHIHGPRSRRDVDTAQIINERLRACAALPPRRRRARHVREKPHILFIARSQWRKFLLQPYLLSSIEHRIGKDFGSLVVAEQTAFNSFRDLVELFSDADISIGIYGAMHTWSSMFLPRSGITTEFNYDGFRYAPVSGLNYNPASEFGGGSVISGVHHSVLADYNQVCAWSHGPNKGGGNEMMSGQSFIGFALEKAMCLLNYDLSEPKNRNSTVFSVAALRKKFESLPSFGTLRSTTPFSISESMLPPPHASCKFGQAEYNHVATQQFQDERQLNQVIRQISSIHLPKEEYEVSLKKSSETSEIANSNSSSKSDESDLLSYVSTRIALDTVSTKLLSFIRFPDILGKVITLLISPARGVRRAAQNVARIIIVEPCQVRASVLQEAKVLTSLFLRPGNIHIAEWAAGKENCLKRNNWKDINHTDSQMHRIYMANRHGFIESTAASGLREHYFTFCEYPCRGYGKFDLILHECEGDWEENCKVRSMKEEEEYIKTYQQSEAVTNDRNSRLRKYSRHRRQLLSEMRLNQNQDKLLTLPSANQLQRELSIVSEGIVLSFYSGIVHPESVGVRQHEETINGSVFYLPLMNRDLNSSSGISPEHIITPHLFVSFPQIVRIDEQLIDGMKKKSSRFFNWILSFFIDMKSEHDADSSKTPRPGEDEGVEAQEYEFCEEKQTQDSGADVEKEPCQKIKDMPIEQACEALKKIGVACENPSRIVAMRKRMEDLKSLELRQKEEAQYLISSSNNNNNNNNNKPPPAGVSVKKKKTKPFKGVKSKSLGPPSD